MAAAADKTPDAGRSSAAASDRPAKQVSQTLDGEVVCVSGFGMTRSNAAKLRHHVQLRGGRLTAALDIRENTVLVIEGEPRGAKWEAAKRAGLPVVKPQWLSSRLTGERSPKAAFAVPARDVSSLVRERGPSPRLCLAGVYAVMNGDSEGDRSRAAALRALGCRVVPADAPPAMLRRARIRTSPAGDWGPSVAAVLKERLGP